MIWPSIQKLLDDLRRRPRPLQPGKRGRYRQGMKRKGKRR